MEANPLPFPPGENPFRCRGSIYSGGVEFCDRNVPGGWQAVVASLSPELARFCGQHFLPSAWYDLFPVVPVTHAAARLRQAGYLETARANARWVAERDIPTVYKLLLMVASAEMVALRLPKAGLRYFDFGEAETKMNGPNSCVIRHTGIPVPVVDWFVACTEVFIDIAMVRAGAKDLHIGHEPPEHEGSRYGIDTVTLGFELGWS